MSPGVSGVGCIELVSLGSVLRRVDRHCRFYRHDERFDNTPNRRRCHYSNKRRLSFRHHLAGYCLVWQSRLTDCGWMFVALPSGIWYRCLSSRLVRPNVTEALGVLRQPRNGASGSTSALSCFAGICDQAEISKHLSNMRPAQNLDLRDTGTVPL